MAHPIEGLMKTAMESIREMVDVNTIVGDAVQAPDGTVIIPISKVCFGFAAGGGEYKSSARVKETEDEIPEVKHPFAGGSGAGVSIHPVAFMVVGQNQIKLLPVDLNSSLDKILDMIPDIIKRMEEGIQRRMKSKSSQKQDQAKEESEE